MPLSRFYVAAISVLFLLSAVPFVGADEGKEEPNQQGEVDFFTSGSEMSIAPSYIVHLNDSVEIVVKASRMGDEFAVNWTKEGIALPLGGGGGDSSHMISPRVLYENGTYKMWYSGVTSIEYRIFYATSQDGLTWTKHGVVLTAGPPGSLDDTKVAFHYVMKDGDTYKMWYSGADGLIGSGGHYRIFYATSPDGVNWTKQGLVLDLMPPGSTESRLVRSPAVIKDSNLYKMWYSGTDDADIRRIHYATSLDGINWTRLGIVLDLGSGGDLDSDSADFPFIARTPCGYLMYYTGYQGSIMRILHATSQDGLSWEKKGLILDVGPDPNENIQVKDAFVLFYASRPQRMWYAGRGSNNRIFSASPNIMEAPLSASVGFYLDTVSPAGLIEEKTNVGFPICGCTNVSTNWTADSPGIHKILAVIDPQNLIEETNESNNIASRDIEVVGPPVTTIVVGEPKYLSAEFYITSATPISFSVWDRTGQGIESTFYKIDSGVWTRYISSFNVLTKGPHMIFFNSTDVLGGVEETKNFSLIVDDTPPGSQLTVGTPSYASADLWISPSTPLTILSADDGCGLSYVEYQLDGGIWQAYTTPFTVQIEGSHVLLYRGIDNLGNAETTLSLNFIVDGTPPSSDVTVGFPSYQTAHLWISPSTPLEFTSLDVDCGLSYIEYQIDEGTWQTHTMPFTVQIEGSHVLRYRGIDHLGNVETDSSLNFIVDGTPPWSTVQIGSPKRDVTPVEVFAETPFTIISTDNGSGVDVIQYRIDYGEWSNYTGSFNLTDFEPGPHTIEYRGTDNIGNVESEESLAVVLIEPTTLEDNQKPLIAILFAIILGLIGSIVALKRPLISRGVTKRRGITFLAVAMPFVTAEIATGILSLFISSIQIPPWTGLGMILDLSILIIGLGVELAAFVKGKSKMEETEDSGQSPRKEAQSD